MKNKLKYLLPLGIVLLCFVLEIMVTLIPKTAIQEKCEESASFFYERQLFPTQIKGIENSRLDYYADCILLNIVYELDGKHPIESVAKSAYFDREKVNVNCNLMEAVYEKETANKEYARYWHGSMVWLRILLCFLNVEQIYLVYSILIFAGILGHVIYFFCRKQGRIAVSFLIGFLLIQGFWMGKCIEYGNNMLLLLIMLPFFIRSAQREDNNLYLLCAISGILTCFVDFLTTETITITVPLFFVLYLQKEKNSLKHWKEQLK